MPGPRFGVDSPVRQKTADRCTLSLKPHSQQVREQERREQGAETSTEQTDQGSRRIEEGGRNGRRWGSQRDRHETKDDSARFKHPSRLSCHIAYAQAGGQFAR